MPNTQPKPDAVARRWMLELSLADKRERDWRKKAEKLWDKYRAKDARRSSFNILWSNTDILLAALYNSDPNPDVRRRFRDDDPIGKVSAEMMERCLSYSIDAGSFFGMAQMTVLDGLVPGRGVMRVRYVPSITQSPPVPGQGDKQEAVEGIVPEAPEELESEQVCYEQCDWADFRHGPGRTWDEVQWVAFRARLSRQDVTDRFGPEVAEQVKYDDLQDEDLKDKSQDDVTSTFKMAQFWEVWDKSSRKVCFVNDNIRDRVVYPVENPGGDPPLNLQGFFPTPKPLQFVNDSNSLIPIPLYDEYRKQADELDRLSARINTVIAGLKLRGLYDSTLGELSRLFDGDDNAMVPLENAANFSDRGGLDKAIWWMPVEQAANVLNSLYVARDQIKQTIYELTGISDIVRGATNPNETLGAQELKANFANVRLQKMQREVQRYMRDILRLGAEVITEKFNPETLLAMSGMKLLSQQQKQQAMAQAQIASTQGQPVPPELQEMLMKPTLEEVVGLMKNNLMREYRIDIETDSTIAATVESDMRGLQELLTGLVNFWQGVGPAVEAGALPIEAVKAISMAAVRRAKMGLEVEDALDKIQQPVPQQPPQEPQKDDQSGQKLDGIGQAIMKVAENQQNSEGQYSQALQSLMDAQLSTSTMLSQSGQGQQQLAQMIQQLILMQQQGQQILQNVLMAVSAPKRIVRDENGRAQGVETVTMQ